MRHAKLTSVSLHILKVTKPNCIQSFLLRKRSSVAATILLFAVATILLVSCVPRAIGDYDETIDSGVTEVQRAAELYFSKLQSTPNMPYDQTFYDDMNSRLAVLKSRASSLPKYPIIVEQLTNLKSEFDLFQKLDKSSSRPLPRVAVTDAESAIAVSVESILRLELALKRGGPPPPTRTK